MPPCRTNLRPSDASRGICTTYCQTFFGSTCARPASISSFEKPSFWKFTRSVSRKTAQPYENFGASSAWKATSANCVTGTPKESAVAWRSIPLPAEQLFDRRKFAMSPFFMKRTLMSCPPMSQMTSTSPKKCTALIMCATVSTMFTSLTTHCSSTSAA